MKEELVHLKRNYLGTLGHIWKSCWELLRGQDKDPQTRYWLPSQCNYSIRHKYLDISVARSQDIHNQRGRRMLTSHVFVRVIVNISKSPIDIHESWYYRRLETMEQSLRKITSCDPETWGNLRQFVRIRKIEKPILIHESISVNNFSRSCKQPAKYSKNKNLTNYHRI